MKSWGGRPTLITDLPLLLVGDRHRWPPPPPPSESSMSAASDAEQSPPVVEN